MLYCIVRDSVIVTALQLHTIAGTALTSLVYGSMVDGWNGIQRDYVTVDGRGLEELASYATDKI